ncbi:MAG: family 10 glycosylhydrolase [Candidatus Limnocylindria bacterium]
MASLFATYPAEIAPIGTAAPAGQFRAFWADAFGEGINDQAEIDALVAATKAAHANAIVAQVVRRGDCFCLRAGLPVNEGLAPGFDPLQALINTAHGQGIEVHAWIIATAMWNNTTPPLDSSHLFNLHGPAASGRDNWVMTRSDGLSKLGDDWYLDPGHPDAAAWVVNTATAIVRNYEVDGINLDRIRYPDGNPGGIPSWGYNPTALERFRAETGRVGIPANNDSQWTAWRRDQISAIMRRVYLDSTALKPMVRVSADTITYGNGPQTMGSFEATRAYVEQLQDWRGWLREGIVDTAMLMNYKRDSLATEPGNQRRMYDEWSEFAKDNQYRRSSVIGTALYLNTIPSSVSQARRAVSPSAAGSASGGWIGYSYRTPDVMADAGTRSGAASLAELIRGLTQPSEYETIVPPVFADTQPVPPMTWKTQAIFGHLRGTALASDGTPLTGTVVQLVEMSAGVVLRSATTDGKGWFGFVDLPTGTYRITTSSTRVTGGVLGQATIVAGHVTTLGAAPPTPTPTPTPSPSPPPAPCQRTDGPGIAAPGTVASGIGGFHASWYGQSGYSTLCPGQTATAVVAYYNSGTRGWLADTMGQVAYLGTWNPEPGQDRPSMLGGDGAAGSPDTDWPRYNRVAVQPAEWVGPNQVAWFQFTIVAPSAPGTYRLAIRPLIEGAQWMEDFGVFWIVTVRAA